METEMRELSFSITGEVVTNIGRSKLYEDNNLDSALDFLTGCMACDELSEREIRHMAIEVLNGEAEIVGTYPGSDYGFKHLEKKDPKYDLAVHIKKLANKLEETEKKYQDLIQKYNFVIDHFTDYRKKNLNEEYESEFGETLFEGCPDDLDASYGADLTPMQSKMLNDYMERAYDTAEHTTEDYGWLEPDGTFHEVGWAQHQQWASDYLNENYPYKDNRDLHWRVDENGKNIICVMVMCSSISSIGFCLIVHVKDLLTLLRIRQER